MTTEPESPIMKENAQDVCVACQHSVMHHHLKAPHRCNGPWRTDGSEKCRCPGWVSTMRQVAKA